MQPRNCGYQRLRDFALAVEPEPAGMSHCLDAEGNTVTSVWFDGEHDQLAVTARVTVETLRTNPFDFLLQPAFNNLPVEYDEAAAELLAPARRRAVCAHATDVVAKYADQVREESNGQLNAFLANLNSTIYKKFECIHRAEGDAWQAAETFEKREGACRDLAVLFVDACRSQGIAARFVSGYQEGDSEQERHELHAWAEVYVPGGGWRGYDPAHGLAVSDRHVAVAAAVDPANAAALTGSFRGSRATAKLEAEIELAVVDAEKETQQVQQQQQQR